jgi:hypothetical protein
MRKVTMDDIATLFTRLATPFHPEDIEWRAGATNSDKTKALALAYITSRAVMDRLDEVVGPQNWRDEYKPGPDGGVICGLSLRIQDEWICKWDGADNTEFEAIKGGLSDAFKRAGYKWGVGRYLYKLENVWVPCELHGKTIALKSNPQLPSWALPDEWVSASGSVVSKNDPTASKSSPERERDILKELGFEVKPPVEITPVKVPAGPAVPTSAKSNGNKAPRSWNGNVVSAVLKARLATSPVEAVRLLNESNLDINTPAEQVISRLQATCKA